MVASKFVLPLLAALVVTACGGGGGGSGSSGEPQSQPSQPPTNAPSANTPYSLAVDITGLGSVVSNPAGVNCSGACTNSFNNGTTVTLTATPVQGHMFTGWSGDCADAMGSCTVEMSRARSVTAAFAPLPAGWGQACGSFYSAGFTLVSGQDNQNIAPIAKPAKGVAISDPAYKTCLVRLTSHATEPPVGFARHEYARRQAFNADNTLVLTHALDGFWHIYNATTYQHVVRLTGPAGDSEPHWHPTDPKLLYFLPQNGVGMKLYRMDVTTNTYVTVADFAPRLRALWPNANAAWTHDYGSPSADGRYFAFSVADASWNGVGIFTYDLATDTILGTYTLPAGSPQALPSMSPSGKYVVVAWSKNNASAVDRFTLDFQNRMRVSANMEHADIALDANGDDAYVAVDYQANGGPVYMVNLRTGARTELFSTYLNGTATGFHFSGKAFRKPGWVLVSSYADYGGARQWIHRKIMAVELKASPTIYHLAHTHAVANGYWTEPHATVNRDFTKIAFNSNWDVDTADDVDAYIVEIPRDAIPAK